MERGRLSCVRYWRFPIKGVTTITHKTQERNVKKKEDEGD